MNTSTPDDGPSVLFELLHSELIAYMDETLDEKSKCVTQLETLGYRIGQSLGEQLTKDTARFKDDLDVMKFICRDFWIALFQKQVDNLRTNHQGVYVLQDNTFKLFTHISAGKQYLESSPKFLALSCGFVRGALDNFGITSIVTAEVSSMPAAKFNIIIQKT